MSNQAVLLTCCLFSLSLAAAQYFGYEDETPREDVNLFSLLRRYVKQDKESRRNIEDDAENWTGRWFPVRPGEPTPPPKVSMPMSEEHMFNVVLPHRVQMGRINSYCDDAKTNLTVDWDNSSENYTCYDSKIVPDIFINPLLYCETIPPTYVAEHKCMNERIEYDDDIPIYGTHRPLWPVYGEYKFLPKQRWLHSLEHGAVVMLYHPCANPIEVKRLKSLVNDCLWRHVITPYNLLDRDRPLALLTWGCRMTMSYVNPTLVKRFIQKKALSGPERIADDGDFTDGLLAKARVVSDATDTSLCPNM